MCAKTSAKSPNFISLTIISQYHTCRPDSQICFTQNTNKINFSPKIVQIFQALDRYEFSPKSVQIFQALYKYENHILTIDQV